MEFRTPHCVANSACDTGGPCVLFKEFLAISKVAINPSASEHQGFNRNFKPPLTTIPSKGPQTSVN